MSSADGSCSISSSSRSAPLSAASLLFLLECSDTIVTSSSVLLILNILTASLVLTEIEDCSHLLPRQFPFEISAYSSSPSSSLPSSFARSFSKSLSSSVYEYLGKYIEKILMENTLYVVTKTVMLFEYIDDILFLLKFYNHHLSKLHSREPRYMDKGFPIKICLPLSYLDVSYITDISFLA